jgi:phosphoribosylformylglycinamidine synthase
MIRRLFVEKREGIHEGRWHRRIERDLGIRGLTAVRELIRYDVEGVDAAVWPLAVKQVFSEMATEQVHATPPWSENATVFAVEYLPGQFDQRADSAEQCLKLLAECAPTVRCAEVLILEGTVEATELERIKAYRINPVDSREASLDLPKTLQPATEAPAAVARLEGFTGMDATALEQLNDELGLAMSAADLEFCQKWFRDEAQRDPSLTELKLLDTYWSDHCRHTTFLTEIEEVSFAGDAANNPVAAAWEAYAEARKRVYGESLATRPVCLMDIALMGMKDLRAQGLLEHMEISEEVNAASIVVPVDIDGVEEEWLVQFKNETHNHPTEIEPFGGAATCLGGAIRDPLSGRSYVYQAMRVTGAGDPRATLEETLPGKLPQRKICLEAAEGYSSYGNQIGLATGQVHEFYHPGYVAKRMEIGAVIAAAPHSQVLRGEPQPGDCIVLVGGRTGRDGIGGATGSSKAHGDDALENAAEVQKGDPPTERKLQRLFRIPEVSVLIKRSNDFGAGGVSVAIGELAPGLAINLDAVPLKYAGLDGTEIALSESQERMAVVLDPKDEAAFLEAAARENLEAVRVAEVTEAARLRMTWRGDRIVDIDRAFLDTNGVRQRSKVVVTPAEADSFFNRTDVIPESEEPLEAAWLTMLGDLRNCSQKGLVERFDSTIGAASILHPFGGSERSTPAEAMAAKVPVLQGETSTGTVMSFGFNPELACTSPFHGAVYAVAEAVVRLVVTGGKRADAWLTLQEYFPRLGEDPERWGLPFAALLGAYTAQSELGIAAIGGKDSMSGTFKDLDVPPTLVAFAVAPVDIGRVLSPEFKQAEAAVLRVRMPRDANELPDWDAWRGQLDAIEKAIGDGKVVAASVIREGGLACALSRMAFGNGIGFRFGEALSVKELFAPDLGSVVLEIRQGIDPANVPGELIGHTCREKSIFIGKLQLELKDLQSAWEAPLEGIYPTRKSPPEGSIVSHLYEPHKHRKGKSRVARPRVLLPVFPGTNCEYDTQRAFEAAGAIVRPLVVRNLTHADIQATVDALVEALQESQILMLAGGFSAGDEPGGSGKFIASLFRNERVAAATEALLHERDGLALGICNGFQALVKLGLLPYGHIRDLNECSPSLTTNTLGRHVSCYVRTKVVSRLSPWLQQSPLGAEYMTPVSHGEGRFIAPENVLMELFNADQVATQYVDDSGRPTLQLPFNPNGSSQAIEGITSPCGRVYGRMGHSERAGPHVGINIPGEKHQPLFASGVAYFTD